MAEGGTGIGGALAPGEEDEVELDDREAAREAQQFML